MKRLQTIGLQILLPLALLGLAYTAGWHAYSLWPATTPRLAGKIASTFAIPRGYTVISIAPTSQTGSCLAGDRVDVLANLDGDLRPVVLDALVIDNNQFLALLIPVEREYVFSWEAANRTELQFRKTVAPDSPRYEEQLRSAQDTLEQRASNDR